MPWRYRVDLPRQGLLDRIEQAKKAKLILVQAPAGYGKSALLRQLAAAEEARGCKVGWITPVSQDSDLSRFMQMFHAVCDKMAVAEPSDDADTGGDLATRLGRINGPALFLFEDYDRFHGAQVDAQLRHIIDTLPPGKRIVVAARHMPDLSSAKLKLQGSAIVLGSVDLRFDLGEAFQFLSERSRLGLEEVRRLNSLVDGWPAALQFINLSLSSRAEGSAAVLKSGKTPEMLDYLADEVLSGQSAERRRLLLDLCLPERLCADLVERLTDVEDGQQALEAISSAGLFLDPIDGERRWFRFHPIFGDFLRRQVAETLASERLAERHVVIAEWFAQAGRLEMAVVHFVAAGQEVEAARCLEQVAEQMVREERLGFIVSMFDEVGAETISNSPALAEAGAIAHGFRRQFDEAHRLLDQRESALSADTPDPVESAELDVIRCFVLAAEDRVETMGELARDAQPWLSDERPFTKGVAHNAHAFWLGAQSQFPEAEELLLKARPLHDAAGSFFGRSYADSILASMKHSQGRLEEAIEHLQSSLRLIEREAPAGTLAGGVIAAHLGEALYERGELGFAEKVITSYLPVIQQQCIVDPLCLGIVTIARIAALQGRSQYAHELYEQLISDGHKHGLVRLVMCGRAELVREATLRGDIETAQRRLRSLGAEARLPGEGQLFFASGEIEVQRITHIRFLIYSGQGAEARAMLQAEIRTAQLKRRHRRLVRLRTLLAVSLEMDGQLPAARRAMIEAIELAAPHRMQRIFFDEGPAVIRLLQSLVAENFAFAPEWLDDPTGDYVRWLLAEAQGAGASGRVGTQTPILSEGPCEALTSREIDILRFLTSGLSNRGLADRLAVSQNTVKFHLRNIYAKLDVNNRMQAIQAARHFKLID